MEMAFMLQALRCDETLNARGFCVWLSSFLLGFNLAANDEFADLCK